jgi:large subunit ribosomal protein L29
MKAQEIREKSQEEIEKLLEESREKAWKLRFEIASQQTKGHRAYRKLKKDMARMLTVLGELKRKA